MTTKKRHCQHPSTSFSGALPFQSLSDLIGQSIIFYLVFWDTPVMRSEYLTCKIKIIF